MHQYERAQWECQGSSTGFAGAWRFMPEFSLTRLELQMGTGAAASKFAQTIQTVINFVPCSDGNSSAP